MYPEDAVEAGGKMVPRPMPVNRLGEGVGV